MLLLLISSREATYRNQLQEQCYALSLWYALADSRGQADSDLTFTSDVVF